MESTQKDLFEILKARAMNVSSFFIAVELAEKDLSEIKALASKRGTGELIDVKAVATKVIAAKKHLDEALIFCVESQLGDDK